MRGGVAEGGLWKTKREIEREDQSACEGGSMSSEYFMRYLGVLFWVEGGVGGNMVSVSGPARKLPFLLRGPDENMKLYG